MNEQLAELAAAIYTEVDGADHKAHRATVTQEIYDWLDNGDGGKGRMVEDLATEWIEFVADAADAMDQD